MLSDLRRINFIEVESLTRPGHETRDLVSFLSVINDRMTDTEQLLLVQTHPQFTVGHMPAPVSFQPLVEPEYDSSVDSTATEQRGSFKFFKGEHSDKIVFVKPKYSTDKKPLTVFRPFPCRSFRNPKGFEPYRKDPGGKNFLGYWVKRLQVVMNVGNPGISYICHNPKDGMFDDRLHPYGVIQRAVRYAVKKGQGKADNWQAFLGRPPEVEPDAAATLKWTGMLEGGKGKGAVLPRATELFLMQGMLLVDDSKKTFGDGKAPIGWGENPTCVFGLTQGVGNHLMKLLNEENESFRGAPDDFEKRYKNGDPVSPETGRFIYVYPKGGDPRQGQYQSAPVDVDPYSQTGGGHRGGGGGDKKEEVGFSCHLDTKYEKTSAVMKQDQQKAMLLQKWMHWDDAYDATGRKVVSGLLHYPSYAEQAQMLARVLPADMIVYAFYGEHNEWLTPELRKKAVESRSVPVQGISPGNGPNVSHAPFDATGTTAPAVPFGSDVDTDQFSGVDQFASGQADEALGAASDLDAELGDNPAAAFDALSAASGLEPNEVSPDAPVASDAGFDPKPAPEAAAEGPGKLAAARAKLAAAKAAAAAAQ